MKIIHTADWHVKDSMIEEAEKCLDFLVETAFKENPELVVIAGDLFDSQDIKLDSLSAKLVVRIVSELANICPVVIVTGTPSHDGNAPAILNYIKGDYPVWVADKPEQIYMIGGELTGELEGYPPDLVISLIPQPSKQFFQSNGSIQQTDQEIGQAMSALFAGLGAQASQFDVPHILVGHFNVSGAFLSNGQSLTGKDIEISKDQLMLACADLICLGHIHAAQQVGQCCYYSGSLFRQNWGEMNPKGFWIHEINSHALAHSEFANIKWESLFIETPCRQLYRATADYTAESIPAEPYLLTSEIITRECAGGFVRCDFTVYQDEAHLIPKEEIKKLYMEAGAADVDVRVIRVPRETIRAAEVLKADSLRDKVVKMAELRGEQVTEGILLKADELETGQADELLERVAG